MTMCSSSVALLLFLLALSALSAFASYYELNIDCGSDRPSTDDERRKWVGDTAYTKSGKSMKASGPSAIEPNYVMDSLRVFSTGQKNCYSVPGVPQQQVLVRASFNYMNYDGNSSPPTFDLLLENSNWTDVNTINDPGRFVFYEAIYLVKGGTVDVCVSQTTAGQIPFMSALEIRNISTNLYTDFNTDTAFISIQRDFFGGVPDR